MHFTKTEQQKNSSFGIYDLKLCKDVYSFDLMDRIFVIRVAAPFTFGTTVFSSQLVIFSTSAVVRCKAFTKPALFGTRAAVFSESIITLQLSTASADNLEGSQDAKEDNNQGFDGSKHVVVVVVYRRK